MTTLKRILSIAVIVGVVCAMAALFMGMGKTEESKEAPDIQEVVAREALSSISIGVLPEEIAARDINPVLSEAEKAEITAKHQSIAKEIYSSKSSFFYSHPESVAAFLAASGQERQGIVPGITIAAGVSSCEITDLKFQGEDRVIAETVTYTWNKRIYKHSDKLYTIDATINCDRVTFELVKEDGSWKILKTLDFIKEFMDNDDSSSKAEMDSIIKKAPATTSYDTYEEAFAAAKTYEMTSILSTETE